MVAQHSTAPDPSLARRGITGRIFMDSGEPEAHAIFAPDDNAFPRAFVILRELFDFFPPAVTVGHIISALAGLYVPRKNLRAMPRSRELVIRRSGRGPVSSVLKLGRHGGHRDLILIPARLPYATLPRGVGMRGAYGRLAVRSLNLVTPEEAARHSAHFRHGRK